MPAWTIAFVGSIDLPGGPGRLPIMENHRFEIIHKAQVPGRSTVCNRCRLLGRWGAGLTGALLAAAVFLPGRGAHDGHAAAAERATARTPVLFTCDFESADWFKAWGVRDKPGNCDLVAADPERKFEPRAGKALRVKIRQGDHYGTSIEYRFRRHHGFEPEEIYFRYYLRLGDGWVPTRGGKLPGVAGTYGNAGWGGRPVDGTNGWSARGLFEGRADGKTAVGFYCYHMDMQGRYGSQWVWDREGLGFLENNRWYCIQQHVKLNTPGKADGVMRGWVDGKPAFEKNGVRMRAVDRLKIEMVWLNVYYGGTWTAPRDMCLYIDDVAVSREPIEPAGP